MEEAQDLCDRLAIMDHGRILAAGTLAELRAMVGERDLLRLNGAFDPDLARGAVEGLDDAEIVSADAGSLLIAAGAASRRLPAILETVAGTGGEVAEITLSQPSLENLFITLTGRELRE